MAEFQVTCVTKPNRFSPHEHITHIGNSADRWEVKREDAIRMIDNGTVFYVVDPSSKKVSVVGVRRDTGKLPYLRTYADNTWNDNLLSLNECSLSR